MHVPVKDGETLTYYAAKISNITYPSQIYHEQTITSHTDILLSRWPDRYGTYIVFANSSPLGKKGKAS